MMRGSSFLVAFCLAALLSACPASSPERAVTVGPDGGPNGGFAASPSGETPSEEVAAAQPKPLPGGVNAPSVDLCDSEIEDCKAPPVKWRVLYGSDLSQIITPEVKTTIPVPKSEPLTTKLLLQGLAGENWENRPGTVRLLLCPAGKSVSECQGCIATFSAPTPEPYPLSLPVAEPSGLQFFRDDENSQALGDCQQGLQPSEGFIYEQPPEVFLGSLILDVVFKTNLDAGLPAPSIDPPSNTNPTLLDALKKLLIKLP